MNSYQKGIRDLFGRETSSPSAIFAGCGLCGAVVSGSKYGGGPRRNALAASSRLLKAERIHLETKHPEELATIRAKARADTAERERRRCRSCLQLWGFHEELQDGLCGGCAARAREGAAS